MGEKIASSTTAAQNAVSKLSGKNVNLSKQAIAFSGSTVTSMTNGLEVANQLVGEVGSLAEAIWAQAEKFPQIAETIAYKDQQIGQLGESMMA